MTSTKLSIEASRSPAQQKVHEEPDRFSLKSVVFVALYCWGAVLTCMAYLCNAAGESVSVDSLEDVFAGMVAVLVIRTGIAARAALPRSPKHQPWKAIYILGTVRVFA